GLSRRPEAGDRLAELLSLSQLQIGSHTGNQACDASVRLGPLQRVHDIPDAQLAPAQNRAEDILRSALDQPTLQIEFEDHPPGQLLATRSRYPDDHQQEKEGKGEPAQDRQGSYQKTPDAA